MNATPPLLPKSTAPARIIPPGIVIALTALAHAAAPVNLAPDATIEADGENPQMLADGIVGIDAKGEWVTETPHNTLWGWIGYPEVKLSWDAPQRINKVVIHDRPSTDHHLAACVLKFSDGSEVRVAAVPNDGTAKTVVFEPREVTGMTLTCVDGVGTRIGISELEVYHDPEARPEVRERGLTDLVSHVDPTIETGRGRWFFCTPGSRPFGMVSASAYTRNKNQLGGGWIEANDWQGTFGVSHDIPGLSKLMGGDDKLVAKLNQAFEDLGAHP